MTGQTDTYRRRIYTSPYEICIERAKYYTESYKETEGQPPAIRAARALEKTLMNMTLYILPEEQIVGNRTSKVLGAHIPVERGEINMVLKMELPKLKSREWKPFQISPEDEKQLFREIFPYWEGKTIRDLKVKMWQQYGLYWSFNWGLRSWIRRYQQFGMDWIKKFYQFLLKGRIRYIREAEAALAANNPNLVNNVFDVQGHMVMGHRNLVNVGYGQLRERVVDRLKEVIAILQNEEKSGSTRSSLQFPPRYADLEGDFQHRFPKGKMTAESRAFLDGVLISIDAATTFIRRFALLAKVELSKTQDATRKSELQRISDACEWLATNPPRNFREAIQLVWFNQVIGIISHGMTGVLAVGRVDQYLLPFYEEDKRRGNLTDDEARELCEELLIKMSYNLLILPSYGKATGSELGADDAAITLGGVSREGHNATNRLSYLFLEATEKVKSMTNAISFRVAPGISPRGWMERVVEVFSKTSGPAVFNDDVIIPALQKSGVSLEDARDYALIGCVEPTSEGNTFGTTSGNDVSLVGLLEMVLTNGSIRNVGRAYGVKTGDPRDFKTYGEVWEAYTKQLEFMVDHIAKCVNVKDYLYATMFPNPFISATIKGCIEQALDITQGGSKYNATSISGRGLATAANSLCAIDQVVFKNNQMSMERMVSLVNRNFKGEEKIRVELANKIPKFGNDDDVADRIAQMLAATFCDIVIRHPCIRGGTFRPGFFSYGMNVVDGFFLGATTDGRLAGEPVSNSLSPANATEKHGPTAVLKSVAKIDGTRVSNGFSLNMRLLPSLLETPEKRAKFADILDAYFQLGGMHVQFNVVKQEDLIDAQLHPEKHLDLVVRVSGYCAYFVDLGKPVQDDIIQRHQFASTV